MLLFGQLELQISSLQLDTLFHYFGILTTRTTRLWWPTLLLVPFVFIKDCIRCHWRESSFSSWWMRTAATTCFILWSSCMCHLLLLYCCPSFSSPCCMQPATHYNFLIPLVKTHGGVHVLPFPWWSSNQETFFVWSLSLRSSLCLSLLSWFCWVVLAYSLHSCTISSLWWGTVPDATLTPEICSWSWGLSWNPQQTSHLPQLFFVVLLCQLWHSHAVWPQRCRLNR